MKNTPPGGDALEKIMRDVLEGLQDFSHRTSLAHRRDSVDNGCQGKMPSARIIVFPRRHPTK